MALGTDNFRTNTLTRHVESNDHKLLFKAPCESQNMKTASQKALNEKEKPVIVALKAMFWLFQENLL